MQLRADGGSDRVASFDAFKISKQHDGWYVSPLTRWAQACMRLHAEDFSEPEDKRKIGAVFTTRGIAEQYVAECERAGESWSLKFTTITIDHAGD